MVKYASPRCLAAQSLLAGQDSTGIHMYSASVGASAHVCVTGKNSVSLSLMLRGSQSEALSAGLSQWRRLGHEFSRQAYVD